MGILFQIFGYQALPASVKATLFLPAYLIEETLSHVSAAIKRSVKI